MSPVLARNFKYFIQHLVMTVVFTLPLVESQGLPEELGEGRFSAALYSMGEVPRGSALLKKVIRAWELENVTDLLKRFKWSNVSRTDTILTRSFNPKTGNEDRKSEVTVYLKRDQSQLELMLDMAHELVHATARPSFDPYDTSLTAGKYIWSAIEGEGGEVQATLTECQIGLELADKVGTRIDRCEAYLEGNPGKEVSRDKVLRDFYRVGKWHHEIQTLLGSEIQLFPLLSKEMPRLYSSTGHMPYPIALFHEFEEITEAACKNSQNRMRNFLALIHDGTRSRDFISKRCHSITN